MGTSVLPSLPLSPNVVIPVENGVGAHDPGCGPGPFFAPTQRLGGFSPREEKKGDRTVVRAWGQKPRPVTSPKPRVR